MREQDERIAVSGGGNGFVELMDVYGSDQTFFQIARICRGAGFRQVCGDEKRLGEFIETLIKLGHLRPFEFAGIVVGIRCPIYVERQLRTYRKPDVERSLRSCEPIELYEDKSGLSESHRKALEEYQNRRDAGERKEDARRVLPLESLTEVASYFTIRSLFHVFDERLGAAAQSQTRAYVAAIFEQAQRAFPLTIEAYQNTRTKR